MDPLLTVGLLIIAGYLLLLMELAIIPGFGISGVAGLICLGAGPWVAVRAFVALTGGLVVSAVIVLTTVLPVGFPRPRFGPPVGLRGSLARAHAHPPDPTPGTATQPPVLNAKHPRRVHRGHLLVKLFLQEMNLSDELVPDRLVLQPFVFLWLQ